MCVFRTTLVPADLHKDEPNAKTEPWSDAHYSFGSRQTVYRMFAGVEGYIIKTIHTPGSYWQDLSSSVFCLASAGWGWGGRMKAAVTRGCIPVITQVRRRDSASSPCNSSRQGGPHEFHQCSQSPNRLIPSHAS